MLRIVRSSSPGLWVVVDENNKVLFGPDDYEACEDYINPKPRMGR